MLTLTIALVGAAAVAGGVLAVRMLLDRPSPRVAADVATSFGLLSIRDVETVPGLTAKDLAGVTHFPSYVGPDQAQVHVSVELANTLERPVAYASGRFRLRVGDGAVVAPAASPSAPTALRPGSALTVTLVFVVPRPKSGRSPLRLEVRDGARTTLVDLATAIGPRPEQDRLSHDH